MLVLLLSHGELMDRLLPSSTRTPIWEVQRHNSTSGPAWNSLPSDSAGAEAAPRHAERNRSDAGHKHVHHSDQLVYVPGRSRHCRRQDPCAGCSTWPPSLTAARSVLLRTSPFWFTVSHPLPQVADNLAALEFQLSVPEVDELTAMAARVPRKATQNIFQTS